MGESATHQLRSTRPSDIHDVTPLEWDLFAMEGTRVAPYFGPGDEEGEGSAQSMAAAKCLLERARQRYKRWHSSAPKRSF